MGKIATFQRAPQPTVPRTDGKKKVWSNVEPGEYVMRLLSFEDRETKAGTGNYLNCKFEVDLPSGKKMLIFQKFNYNNKNPKAVTIALRDLDRLSNATFGGTMGDDTDNLERAVGKDFKGRVVIEENRNPAFTDSNKIITFFSL